MGGFWLPHTEIRIKHQKKGTFGGFFMLGFYSSYIQGNVTGNVKILTPTYAPGKKLIEPSSHPGL